MIWRDRFIRRLAVIGLCVAIGSQFLMTGAGHINPFDPVGDLKKTFAPDPVLTESGLAHITKGDARGGGHLHGTGKPCKSEFPPAWTSERIKKEIPLIAANDNLTWQQQRNGYVVAETSVENLRLRIVVDPKDNEIVTAYPTNVPRNPCPARDAANDNNSK